MKGTGLGFQGAHPALRAAARCCRRRPWPGRCAPGCAPACAPACCPPAGRPALARRAPPVGCQPLARLHAGAQYTCLVRHSVQHVTQGPPEGDSRTSRQQCSLLGWLRTARRPGASAADMARPCRALRRTGAVLRFGSSPAPECGCVRSRSVAGTPAACSSRLARWSTWAGALGAPCNRPAATLGIQQEETLRLHRLGASTKGHGCG